MASANPNIWEEVASVQHALAAFRQKWESGSLVKAMADGCEYYDFNLFDTLSPKDADFVQFWPFIRDVIAQATGAESVYFDPSSDTVIIAVRVGPRASESSWFVGREIQGLAAMQTELKPSWPGRAIEVTPIANPELQAEFVRESVPLPAVKCRSFNPTAIDAPFRRVVYEVGVGPSPDSHHPAVATVEPWSLSCHFRGYLRVNVANQPPKTTAAYQMYYGTWPDAWQYNNCLLLSGIFDTTHGQTMGFKFLA